MSKTRSASSAPSYDASSFGVLKGLEPVQKRPGMYTDTESPNHILAEVVDNAQDEALAGFVSRIQVELHDDGSVSVDDDGRGIPVDKHPTEKRPVVELAFTTLHAGGKFDTGDDKAYKFTGGLHGVGVSVTNALSKRLDVHVWRDGMEHAIVFENGAIVKPLHIVGPADPPGRTGTRVHFWPDPVYFEHGTIQIAAIERYLRSKAVLVPGVEMTWRRPGKQPMVWTFANGMVQYLEEGVAEQGDWAAPLFMTSMQYDADAGTFSKGEGFDLALGWLEAGRTMRESYVNLIPTRQGGKHEAGLRAGLFEAVRNVAERMGIIPKGVKLEPEDVWSRACFVLSVKLTNPHFQNQTKDKMTSEKGHRLVHGLLRDNLELWLNDHPESARSIVSVVIAEAVRRSKASTKVDRRRPTGTTVLPGKLADCELRDVNLTELFLVEGDSAGGSSKEGRDRSRQAILPLRGKLLNTWETDSDQVCASETIANIAQSIGVEPHQGQPIDTVDLSRLRYGRICIMADADVDGLHIQVLLLTLFFRHFPALIAAGVIWIAQPPLYRVDAPPKKRSRDKSGQRKFYALDGAELEQIKSRLYREGLADTSLSISRFKGLGEMSPQQLWETTMDPASRRLLLVKADDHDLAVNQFEMMMSKKNADLRRTWIEENAPQADPNE